jgi:hypothetical protein
MDQEILANVAKDEKEEWGWIATLGWGRWYNVYIYNVLILALSFNMITAHFIYIFLIWSNN